VLLVSEDAESVKQRRGGVMHSKALQHREMRAPPVSKNVTGVKQRRGGVTHNKALRHRQTRVPPVSKNVAGVRRRPGVLPRSKDHSEHVDSESASSERTDSCDASHW
jgi:hypothetical protein